MEGMEAFLGQRHEGILSSWKSPWGWVSCPKLGCDLFVHTEDLVSGALAKGATLSFEVGIDPKSGKHRALQIEAHGAPGDSGAFADAAEGGCCGGKGLGALTGPRVEGVVSNWKEPWGWFSCATEEKDIFAHREDVIGGDPYVPLEAGQVVTFVVGTDAKSGRRRALQIDMPVKEERLHGMVTSWKDQWGWITCTQIQDGDVFAHKEDLCGGAYIEAGMHVSFELGIDSKGRRRARKIGTAGGFKGGGKFCSMISGNAGIMNGKASYKGCMMPMFKGAGGWKGGPPSPAAFVGQQLNGIVASWKDQWGWVSSPLFAGDIFAHAEDLQFGMLPTVGEHVVFTVGYDSKGRVRALHIHVGGWPGFGSEAPKPFKKRKKVGSTGDDGKSFEGLEGHSFEGEVASWKSPWGWIKCSGYDGDLFAHKEDIETGEELSVGQAVSFTVGRDEKSGRWRARQITVMGPAPKQMRTTLPTGQMVQL